MKAKFKRRLIINLSILVGGIIILGLIVFLLNMDISRRVNRINDFKNELTLRNQTVDFLSRSTTELEKIEPALNILKDILPEKDQLINFPRELEQLANQYSIDIGFNFGNEVASTESDPGKINFDMRLAGGYDQITGFLSELEENPYFISIATININLLESGNYALVASGVIYTK
jgi:Tfp pilus assembly protein PilO